MQVLLFRICCVTSVLLLAQMSALKFSKVPLSITQHAMYKTSKIFLNYTGKYQKFSICTLQIIRYTALINKNLGGKTTMKKIALILTLVMLISCFSFPTAAFASEPIQIRVMSRWGDDGVRSTIFRDMIEEFNASQSEIVIVGEHTSDEPSYLDKLRTAFATGDQPEVFFGYGGSREIDYARHGLLVDFDPILEADSEWASNFLPLFDKWQYSEFPGTFGVPAEFYATAIFYNIEIFQEQGIEPPKTIEEFEAVCDQLLANGYIPMSLGAKDPWRVGHVFNNLVMKAYGSAAVDALADRSLSYDSKEIVDALAKIADWNNKGYFGANAISVDYNMEQSNFENGKSAMHMDGSWYLGAPVEKGTDGTVGVMAFPYTNEEFAGTTFGSSCGFSVCKNEDPAVEEAAIRVVKHLTSKEFFMRSVAADKGGLVPIAMSEEDLTGIEISDVSKRFNEVMATATEFRDDIQTYDTVSSLLDAARLAVQSLFIGTAPEQAAAEIMAEISVRE